MGFSMDEMMDKITGYDEVLTMFEFKHKGSGNKSWSIQHENKKGQIVEIRDSEWTLYENDEKVIGKSPDELKRQLLKQLSKDELINLIMW